MAGHQHSVWTVRHSMTLSNSLVTRRKPRLCHAHASARPARQSKHPVARPSPKGNRKPGSSGKPQRANWQTSQTTKQSDEAADLASIRQQKANNASKKVRSVSGLQRTAALQGLSPVVKPFSVALAAYKVSATQRHINLPSAETAIIYTLFSPSPGSPIAPPNHNPQAHETLRFNFTTS